MLDTTKINQSELVGFIEMYFLIENLVKLQSSVLKRSLLLMTFEMKKQT